MYESLFIIIYATACYSAFDVKASCNFSKYASGPYKDTKSFANLEKHFWNWQLEEYPQFATSIDINGYKDQLDSFSLAIDEKRWKRSKYYLRRLQEIDVDSFETEVGRTGYWTLKDTLQTYSDGYKWRLYGSLTPVNYMEGIHMSLTWFIIFTKFKYKSDFEDFLKKLNKVPVQVEQSIERMRKAISIGTTNHNRSKNVPGTIDIYINRIKKESRLYQMALSDTYNGPIEWIRTLQRVDITTTGKQIHSYFKTAVNGLIKLKNFMANEYLPNTRPTIGVGSMKDGYQYYSACLRWHSATNMTPEEVSSAGMKEIKRINVEIKKIMKGDNFDGNLRDFVAHLKKDPKHVKQTKDELMEEFKDLIYVRIKDSMSKVFRNYPKIPLTIEQMLSDLAIGFYWNRKENGTMKGTFLVNLFEPEKRPLFQLPTIALHEGIPGHHLQMTYTFTKNFSKWREHLRKFYLFPVPFQFPSYTSFIEGWGLYAEYLGEEMGVFRTKYELLGKYEGEILRAARMVVDPGIHIYNWTWNEAVDFMRKHTSYADSTIEAEVNRYITWPGMAPSYKMGEMKILQMRHKSEKALKDAFDVRDFHDIVLRNGPVPWSILEENVDEWISQKLKGF